MDQLLALGRQLGLSVEDVGTCLRLGRPLSECNWCIANDVGQRAQEVARDMFETGRLIEYHCYDDHGHGQGRGVLRLVSWEDTAAGLFTAEHGPLLRLVRSKQAVPGCSVPCLSGQCQDLQAEAGERRSKDPHSCGPLAAADPSGYD